MNGKKPNLQIEGVQLKAAFLFLDSLGFDFVEMKILPKHRLIPEVTTMQAAYSSKVNNRELKLNLGFERTYYLNIVIINTRPKEKVSAGETFTPRLLLTDWAEKFAAPHASVENYNQREAEDFESFLKRAANQAESLFENELKEVIGGTAWVNLPFDHTRY